jgi:hypothetical protein
VRGVQELERLVADGRQPLVASGRPERLEDGGRVAALEQQQEAVAVLADQRQRRARQRRVRDVQDAQVLGRWSDLRHRA